MKTRGNTIIITGGATGIGLALAEVFLREKNDVVICGRREHKLFDAKKKLPEVHTATCDVADAEERKSLFNWATTNFGALNVLVNNAGIQKDIDFRKGTADQIIGKDEIEANLLAPIHLCGLFIPHLMRQEEAAIVNITSGLGFIPLAVVPVYCATKAALHSFTWSLRHQLKDTSIKVFEVAPPLVDTELNEEAREIRLREDRGITPGEVAEAAIHGMEKDEYDIAIGKAAFLRTGARSDPEQTFLMINAG
jgi:uncharacterized oxidoreductase